MPPLLFPYYDESSFIYAQLVLSIYLSGMGPYILEAEELEMGMAIKKNRVGCMFYFISLVCGMVFDQGIGSRLYRCSFYFTSWFQIFIISIFNFGILLEGWVYKVKAKGKGLIGFGLSRDGTR